MDKQIKVITDLLINTFGNTIRICEIQNNTSHMGFFQIKAEYLPLNYELTLEHAEGTFNIYILDTDGAQTSLYSYEKYESQLNNKNVSSALFILKRMLEENSFDFLININDEYFLRIVKLGK